MTSELFLFGPTQPTRIATNRDSGLVVPLGSFPEGVELIFGIQVPGGQIFQMGPLERNPDRLVHAAVELVEEGRARVGFEDQYDGGDNDYDDFTFEVRGAIELVPPLEDGHPLLPGEVVGVRSGERPVKMNEKDCTLAFLAQKPGNDDYWMITAQHCASEEIDKIRQGSRPVDVVRGGVLFYGGAIVGLASTCSKSAPSCIVTGTDYDAMAFRINPVLASNQLMGAGLVTGVDRDLNREGSEAYRPPLAEPGKRVCLVGGKSGTRCGEITHRNGQNRVVKVCSRSGDSGGAVVNEMTGRRGVPGNVAVGIVRGSDPHEDPSPGATCEDEGDPGVTEITLIQEIEDELGIRVRDTSPDVVRPTASTCDMSGSTMTIRIGAFETVEIRAGLTTAGRTIGVDGRGLEDSVCRSVIMGRVTTVNVTGTDLNEALALGRLVLGKALLPDRPKDLTSSGIRFNVDLGAGTDRVLVRGGPDVDVMNIGRSGLDIDGDGSVDMTTRGIEYHVLVGDKLSGLGATGRPMKSEAFAGTLEMIDDQRDESPGSKPGGVFFEGGLGANRMIGGNLNDFLTGNQVGDYILGGGGVDTIRGEGGEDLLFGGGGDDKLKGNPDRLAIIDGGDGKDTCTLAKKESNCEA